MLTFVSDVFLTDHFLIKGTVENKYTRLSQLLDGHRKRFLKIKDATLVDLKSRDRIQTPLLHINLDEVLLAHEFLDNSNDASMAQISKNGEWDHRVRAFYTGALNLEVAGEIRPDSYEVTDHRRGRFFVMRNPVVRGLEWDDDDDLKLLSNLEYAIMNRERLAYLYDFNN
jgi:hypothetical protein